VAIRVAEQLGGEVLSVDSMQVYRGMDIGTAKPTLLERRGVPHHMIDVVDPEDEFTVAEFRRIGRRALEDAGTPVVVITGGSGLHFRALVDPMSFAPTDAGLRAELEVRETGDLVGELLAADSEAGTFVDLANPRRVVRAVEVHRLTGETPSARAGTALAQDVRRYVPEIGFEALGVDPGADLDVRIDARLDEMRRGGLVDEVRALRPRLGRTARSALGYREIAGALDGITDLDEAFRLIAANTKRLARRQRTWFQRDPRIRWIPWIEDIEQRTDRILGSFG
jgi:tRNA dimethylallyltransferase